MTKQAKAFISKKIKMIMHEGYPQQQAIAIAHSMARKAGYSIPKLNPKVLHMMPRIEWQKLPYRKQKQILEFIDGYTQEYGTKKVKLVPALMHMFNISEGTADYVIDLFKKVKPKKLRKNRERLILDDPFSIASLWDRFDIFIKRVLELSVYGYRDKGLTEEQIAAKLVKEFALTSREAEGILKDILPIKVPKMKDNPVKCNLAGTVKIYDTILAIEARKGNSSESLWPNENFRHDFKDNSKAAVYGLDDGSILIKSQNGKRLWNTFNYDEEDV